MHSPRLYPYCGFMSQCGLQQNLTRAMCYWRLPEPSVWLFSYLCLQCPPSFFLWMWLANIAVFVWISSEHPPISFMSRGWRKPCVFSLMIPTMKYGFKTWYLEECSPPSYTSQFCIFTPAYVYVLWRADLQAQSCYSRWAWWEGYQVLFFLTFPKAWLPSAGLSLTAAISSTSDPNSSSWLLCSFTLKLPIFLGWHSYV